MIVDSTVGFQSQPDSGDIPRPSLLLHMDLCIWLCRRQCRRHKLQPSNHFWLWVQQDQDSAHGHSSSSRSYGRWCDPDGSFLQSAKCTLHLMDLLCHCRHDRRNHGSRSGRGDTTQRIAGWCLPHGFLQCPLGFHAKFVLVQRSRCDQKKLYGRVHCGDLW